MARPRKNAEQTVSTPIAQQQQFAPQAAPTLNVTKAPPARKSEYNHIEYIDVNEDGVLEEIAVVKRWEDGSLSYILVSSLGGIDKGRLLKIITSPHADKYELWDLMAQIKLTNGMNALDFYHQNLIKIKRVKGSVSQSLGSAFRNTKMMNVENGQMVGSDFSDPTSAQLSHDSFDTNNVV
jgi:hypothetical protein